MSDGFDNWLECKIGDLKRVTEDESGTVTFVYEWDEYLKGRQRGFETTRASYREYIRRTNL